MLRLFRFRTLALSLGLSCALAGAHAATEVYDTRTGELPSWVRPVPPSAELVKADALRREAQRLQWLKLSPLGSRDFCAASSPVSGGTTVGLEGAGLSCFMGGTTAQELRANGWELTQLRRSIHPHAPGYEVEVVNLVVVKTQCVDSDDGRLRGPVKGRYGCTAQSRDADLHPGLFWMSEAR